MVTIFLVSSRYPLFVFLLLAVSAPFVLAEAHYSYVSSLFAIRYKYQGFLFTRTELTALAL